MTSPLYNGWTPTEEVKPANKAQLLALRDLCLTKRYNGAAAAIDNVINLLEIEARIEDKLTDLYSDLDEWQKDWQETYKSVRPGGG